MKREEFAKKIRWNRIFWLLGIINVGAQFPQTWKLIHAHITTGLSVEMILIYFATQIGLALQGFFKRDVTLIVTMGLSALVSLLNIVLYFMYS